MTLSYRNEEKVRRAFAVLVDATPIGADFDELTVGLRAPTPRRWSRLTVTITAVVATLAVFTPLILLGDKFGPAATSGSAEPPAEVPVSAPSPGSVAPFLESPPAWFGEPVAGEREAADRTGRWVSTAIGLESGNEQVSSPVSIAVTDGTLRGLDDAEEIVVDGQMLRSLRFGDWQALATVAEPTVVVSGAVETALLAEVLSTTTVVGTTAGDSISLSRLPAGYVEQVPPQLHADDIPLRRTLTNAAGDVSINEISDWVVPELAAAASGADYRLVGINGAEGWTGHTVSNPYGPLTFLVWSPQPGVVFEIVSTGDERTIEQLVELAMATTAVSATEWDQAFGR